MAVAASRCLPLHSVICFMLFVSNSVVMSNLAPKWPSGPHPPSGLLEWRIGYHWKPLFFYSLALVAGCAPLRTIQAGKVFVVAKEAYENRPPSMRRWHAVALIDDDEVRSTSRTRGRRAGLCDRNRRFTAGGIRSADRAAYRVGRKFDRDCLRSPHTEAAHSRNRILQARCLVPQGAKSPHAFQ